MVKFRELGYSTEDEYLQDFQKTLLRSTYTYDYFVDWQKVEKNAKEHVVELAMLDSLTHASSYVERRKLLRKLLSEHPRILTAIPMLLAVRESEIEVADLTQQIISKRFDFASRTLSSEKLDDMVMFCEKTGIINLFEKIKDGYSYILGAEVGLDSNARKNRSGDVFKNLIDHLLTVVEAELSKSGLIFSHKAEVRLEDLGISQNEKKKVDFMIYQSGKPLAACEANVYNVQGSKPTEIIRSYAYLNDLLRQRGMTFFWFTDGPAWNKMWSPLENALRSLDYVMNYTIASKATPAILRSIQTRP